MSDTSKILIRAIQKNSSYCCPHKFFSAHKNPSMELVAKVFGMTPDVARGLKSINFIVTNTKCWRCRLREYIRGL